MADWKNVAIADLERQIAELRAERDRLLEKGFDLISERESAKAKAENARLKALPLKDEVERVLVEDDSLQALIGSVGNEVHNLGCEYQNDEALSERLGSLASRLWDLSLLSRLRAGEQEGWRHGPYGYLIKPIGLNEDHWHLAIEPSAYPGEEVSVPLYADQDQLRAAPKQGEAK